MPVVRAAGTDSSAELDLALSDRSPVMSLFLDRLVGQV